MSTGSNDILTHFSSGSGGLLKLSTSTFRQQADRAIDAFNVRAAELTISSPPLHSQWENAMNPQQPFVLSNGDPTGYGHHGESSTTACGEPEALTS